MGHIEKPPKWADDFLKWYCEVELYDEISGDLHEAFYYRLKTFGCRRARLEFVKDVIKFCKPYSWKKFKTRKQDIPMLKNYFKIGLRNIIKHKEYSLLNASGLIIGMTCIFFSMLYLRNETRYDRFHNDAEDIYRIQRRYRSQEYTVMPFKQYWETSGEDQLNYINELKKNPAIKNAIQLTSTQSATSIPQYYIQRPDGQRFVEKKIVWTNSGNEFFDILDWEFVQGSPSSAFDNINSIVLTEAAAVKYLGKDWNSNLINQSLFIDSTVYQVTGVIRDVPDYSHIDLSLIINTSQIPSWGSYVYVKMDEAMSKAKLLSHVNEAYFQYMPNAESDPLEKGLTIVNLPSIYLESNALYELKPPGDVRYLWVFAIIALIVLVVMLTNYLNLSVALYVGRQKEIGMRKVLGARKGNTIFQFLFEALLIVFICLPIAVLCLHLLLPLFNATMDAKLTNDLLTDPGLATLTILFTLFIGLVSGIYPALILSGRKTAELFKNKLSNAKDGIGLRRLLVGFQFLLLIGLGTATYFINNQLHYLLQKDLGFTKEGVISINVGDAATYQKMKNSLSTNPKIISIGSGGMPGNEMFNTLTYKMFKASDDEVNDNGTHLIVDPGSLEVLEIDHPSIEKLSTGATSVFLINRTGAEVLASTLGVVPEQLIGEVLVLEPEYENEEAGTMGVQYTIDGIVEDYHHFTLKETMNPLFIEVQAKPGWTYEMLFRLSKDNIFATIDEIEKEYDKWHQEEPIQIEFLEERLANLYKKEQQIANLTVGLSCVVVFLSFLGLIGLVSFITKSKESEIGIRKVFGANIKEILVLLNKDFLILVTLATVFSAPLSYMLIDKWLAAFAYRVEPTFYIYILAGIICIMVVGVIVSLQSLKAAYKNPVETIKCE